MHPGAKKNSVTTHFVNLIFSRFYRTTSLPGRLVPRRRLELNRVSAGKKKKKESFHQKNIFFSNMWAYTILAENLLFQVWNCPTTAHGHSSQMIPVPILFFSSKSRICFGCIMIVNPDENPRICDVVCFQLNQRNISCAVWGMAISSLWLVLLHGRLIWMKSSAEKNQ